jgi:hypothetical protein
METINNNKINSKYECDKEHKAENEDKEPIIGCWELIDSNENINENENDTDNSYNEFSNHMYKLIAYKKIYKTNYKLITRQELMDKKNKPYKKSPLRNFVTLKSVIISNDKIYKTRNMDVLINDWVIL